MTTKRMLVKRETRLVQFDLFSSLFAAIVRRVLAERSAER